MKAAVFYGKKDIRVQEIKVREPEDNEVVIKVEVCGVCGTDKHIYEGAAGAAPTPPETVLGHEFSGIVYKTGKDVKDVSVGDRVCVDPNDMCGECYYCRQGKGHFCENMIGIGTTFNGGFAEYCTVNAKQAYKIPDNLSLEEAAMTEPVACCLHGIDLSNITPGQTVIIIGGGTIGMIMIQLVKISGASRIILVEPIEAKREIALELGVDIVVDPINESIDDVLKANSIKQIDTAIECVGLVKTMNMAIEYTGNCGTAMLFGLTNPDNEMSIKPFDIFKKEISIKASFINPYTQKRALDLLSSKKINVEKLITDIVPLSQINKVFESEKYKGSGKILIKT